MTFAVGDRVKQREAREPYGITRRADQSGDVPFDELIGTVTDYDAGFRYPVNVTFPDSDNPNDWRFTEDELEAVVEA